MTSLSRLQQDQAYADLLAACKAILEGIEAGQERLGSGRETQLREAIVKADAVYQAKSDALAIEYWAKRKALDAEWLAKSEALLGEAQS